jgi:hypothetical protein
MPASLVHHTPVAFAELLLGRTAEDGFPHTVFTDEF